MPRPYKKRLPLFLRGFLTASSVLAGVLVASAFSFAHPQSAHPGSPVAAAVSGSLPDAHAAQLKALAASKAHAGHLSHLGHQRAVAQQVHLAAIQAQARKIVKHKPALQAPRAAAVTVAAPQAPSSYSGSGRQACVISRESGGNPNAMNASGHYGLYQFSYSTWVGSGGSGADFGHAPVAEQNQVFANAVAARGYSDWAPYDGC
jgi:hypothetical protein